MLGKKMKFKSSEELTNTFEKAHYTGARQFFFASEQIPKEEREDAIKDMLKQVRGSYSVITDWLNEQAKELEGEDLKEIKQIIATFTEARFLNIIELAQKDHKTNYGVSKYKTSWK